MIGNSDADWVRTSGSSACCGSSMPSRALPSSASASSVSVSSENSMSTTENPADEVDRTLSIPSTSSTAASTGCVTCSSTRSGPAPGTVVETVTIGNSISGKSSWLRRVVAYEPATTSMTAARKTTDLFRRHQRTTVRISSPPPAQRRSPLSETSNFSRTPRHLVGQPREGLRRPPPPDLHGPEHHIAHLRRAVYEHHATIRRRVPALDHPVLDHPVHELGHGRRRDTQSVSQLAHRMRAPRE